MCELTQQVVPILRTAGKLRVLPLERFEVRFSALHALLQRAVEVADHLPRALELLGREVPERIAHVLEVRAEHLLLQVLQQLLVLLGRLLLDELVVLERAHRAAEVVGERVELRESLLRDLLHALAELLVRRLCVAPPLEALALEALHLLELLLELVEHLGEIVTFGPLLLGGTQPLEQVLHALHATRHAPSGQSCECVLEVASSEQLVGDRAEELVRLERVEALRSIPARVLDLATEVVEPRKLAHALGIRAVWSSARARALASRRPLSSRLATRARS